MNASQSVTNRLKKQYLWIRCINVVALTTYDYHEELSRLLSSPPDQSPTTCLLESGFIR